MQKLTESRKKIHDWNVIHFQEKYMLITWMFVFFYSFYLSLFIQTILFKAFWGVHLFLID